MLLTNLNENNVVNGKTQAEREYVFFGRIKDFRQLDRASKVDEYHQWSIDTDNNKKGKDETKGSIRVRSVNDKVYILTVKNKGLGKDGSLLDMETETHVTKDMFNSFRALAVTGSHKFRYSFPTDGGLTWEIDVYVTENGDLWDWVKIDLESPRALSKFPEFPIDLDPVVDSRDKKNGREASRMVFSKGLYTNPDSILPIRGKWS